MDQIFTLEKRVLLVLVIYKSNINFAVAMIHLNMAKNFSLLAVWARLLSANMIKGSKVR